jgi:hypothetical protein
MLGVCMSPCCIGYGLLESVNCYPRFWMAAPLQRHIQGDAHVDFTRRHELHNLLGVQRCLLALLSSNACHGQAVFVALPLLCWDGMWWVHLAKLVCLVTQQLKPWLTISRS